MAERSSQELGLRIDVTDKQAYQGGGRAQVKDYDVQDTSNGLNQVLTGILNVGMGVAQKKWESNVQEEVVRGARARMAGEAEDAIESDAFAAPFVRNGYKQQDYRIKQADFSLRMSQLAKNDGRKLTPEEFRRRMASESDGILAGLDGLPPEAHMQALMQQTKAEETLFTEQAQTHANWLIEQGTKPFLAQGNSILAKLNSASASGDDLTYRAATEEAALYHMNLLNTPAIPDGQREKVAKQFLMGALDLNQRKVYEDLRDAGALDTMSFDDRRELNQAYERSTASTRAKDSMVDLERDATFQTGVISGTVGMDEAATYAKDRVGRGLWSAEQALSFVQNAQKGVANRQLMSGMVTALESGDINTLNTLGFEVDEALTQYDKLSAANGVPVSQRLANTTKLGLKLGVFPKNYGAAVGASVRAVLASTDGQVQPEMINTLNTVAEQVAQAELTNPSAGNVMLQGIPEEQRGAMAFMLRQARLGIEPGQALKEYGAQDLVATQQEDFQKFQNSQKFQKSLTSKVDDKFLSGAFGRIGNFLTGSSNLSDNEGVLSMYRRAVQDEAFQLSGDRRNAGLLTSPVGHEALLNLAAANVAERTIQVGKDGVLVDRERAALILPRGLDAAAVFGSRDSKGIGRELADRYPPDVKGIFGDKSTVAFEYTRQNGLYRIQYDANGQELDRSKIDPKSIGTAVNQRNAEHVNAQRAADLGAEVDAGGGNKLTIDGGNASGLQRRGVYDWRRDMLSHEGYRETVYQDANGLAVGVGRNVTGKLKEGDTITRAQAEQWFAEDTDNALIAGARIAKDLGVSNQQAILGLAGAAFQLGEAGLGEFKATKKAIQNKDWDTFQKQVYDSKWAQQTPERVKAFLAYMQPHFTEMDRGPDWYSEATAR